MCDGITKFQKHAFLIVNLTTNLCSFECQNMDPPIYADEDCWMTVNLQYTNDQNMRALAHAVVLSL